MCCLLAAVMVLMSLSGCVKSNTESETSEKSDVSETVSNPPSSVEGLFLLKNMPDYGGDKMLEASVYGNTLKLNYIEPSLDTIAIQTTLYSLTDYKQLGQIDLPDKSWDTGSLESGFYAASLGDCEVTLYDTACKEILRKKPAEGGTLWAFADVSPDGKYLLYGNAVTAEIYLYSLADDSQKKVGDFSGYIDTAGFAEGCFFLKNSDGVLMKVDPAKEKMETVYADRRVNFITPYYGLNRTDANFLLLSSESNTAAPQYIPFQSVDELPIASGKTGFVTCASETDDDILRVYRINEKDMFSIKVPGSVWQVLYTDSGLLVILAKNRQTDRFELYLHNASSAQASKIELNDTDTIVPSDEPPAHQDPVDTSSNAPTEPSKEESSKPSTNAVRIKGVPVIAQMPKFPTGCESVSAVMALQFAGENVSVDQFVDEYLDKSSNFYNADGVRYGPNPYEEFVGNPRSRSAFGCMAPVIEKALIKYYSSSNPVKNTTGKSLEELCGAYIDRGIPVIVWTSIKMIEPRYTSSWYLANGEKFTWLANEHCMLLIGYDDENYYFNDPYTGKEVKYSKSLSEKRYTAFGKQPLVIES